MISQGQFVELFEELEASFARPLPAKVKDGWFKEVEYCYFGPFKVAMRKLALGEKLPHFVHFWVQYNLAKKEMQGAEEVERGCDGCRYGSIHHRIFDKKQDCKVDHTGSCRNCYPERKRTLDPNKPYDYQPGMEPWHVARSVQIPPETAKGMIQELREKMTRNDVDWEQETKQAWALHERVSRGKGASHG